MSTFKKPGAQAKLKEAEPQLGEVSFSVADVFASTPQPLSELSYPPTVTELPDLYEVLAEHPFPLSSVFLGLAEDGLPVLLDVYDPVPGPILVASDREDQNRQLLLAIATSAQERLNDTKINPIVLTAKPIWTDSNVDDVYDPSQAEELLKSMCEYARKIRAIWILKFSLSMI